MYSNYRLISVFLLLLNLVANHSVDANSTDYRYQKAFKVQRLSLNEGLSQSVVMAIMQDQQGYIWIATEDGLNRFDSYSFKVFRHDHRNEKSLHENWVLSLVEEPGYGIWVGTYSGLSFYDPKDQSFTDYSIQNGDLRSPINHLIYSKEGKTWIGSDNGLFYVDRKNNSVVPFYSNQRIKIDEEIQGITESDKYIFLASSQCILKIDKQSNQVEKLCQQKSLAILEDKLLNSIMYQDDELWIGTSTGLFRYNETQDTLIAFYHNEQNADSLSDDTIQGFAVNSKLGIWIATTGGLDYYNRQKQIFEHYKKQKFSQEGLSSNDIRSLYIDNENLLWLGTYGGGINILDPNQHQFEHLLTKADVQKVGDNNTVHGIEKDINDTLWLGTYGGGLLAYNLLSGEITRPLNQQNISYDQYVYALAIDYSNHLWVGSIDDVNIIEVNSKKVMKTQFYLDGEVLPAFRAVNVFYEDYLGTLWIGSEYGLYKVEETKIIDNVLVVKMKNWTSRLPNSFTRYRTNINAIISDKNGDFWFAGVAGLLYYQVEQDRWQHFRYNKENPQSLSNDSVQVLFEDSLGFLWVGTADGLNRLVRSGEKKGSFYFERITTYEGLPNNSIYGILEDKQKQLWLSTNLGLVQYTKNNNYMDVYRSIDGLSSDEFNTNAYFSDPVGQLYFGSINGVTIVNEGSKKTKPDNRNLIFTGVKVGSREMNLQLINRAIKPSISQKVGESSIDIEVANISFNRLGTQRYRYRILGLDERWNYLGTRRKLFIAGLQSGDYVLEIQSQLASHDWNKKIRKLYIHVESDFWSSREGFYSMAIIITLAFIFSIYFTSRYYRNRVIRVRKKIGMEILRSKELRIDIDGLKSTIKERESELNFSAIVIKDNQQQMEAEQHRDIITGLYRMSYIERLFIALDIDKTNKKETELKLVGIAVIEIDNFENVYTKLGPLASSELKSAVSKTLVAESSSATRLFSLQGGLFLALGEHSDCSLFIKEMEQIKDKIIISKFDIANGLFESSSVSLSICDMAKGEIFTCKTINLTIDFVIEIHQQLVKQQIGFSKVLASSLVPVSSPDKTENCNIKHLLEQGEISAKDIK